MAQLGNQAVGKLSLAASKKFKRHSDLFVQFKDAKGNDNATKALFKVHHFGNKDS
jgi:hypothetical protein